MRKCLDFNSALEIYKTVEWSNQKGSLGRILRNREIIYRQIADPYVQDQAIANRIRKLINSIKSWFIIVIIMPIFVLLI